MKKILALVAVVALVAFAAPAFANVNPFMDVPMNHWAYDAIGQLAARGVLSGYPDGTYKGNQPMTRYEAASAIARALAVVDMTKASKQDVEMLKRLVVEFKDELDALGVKVDQIDSRLAVIEERLGGWKLWGEFRYDAWFGAGDDVTEPNLYGTTGSNRFNVSRYRIWMRRFIDDKVTFTARLGSVGAVFERYFLTVKFPWDITAHIGKGDWYDWEDEDGLYIDNDAMFANLSTGFYFNKPFAMGNFVFFVNRPDEINLVGPTSPIERYDIGARVKLNFNEQLWLSLNGILRKYDSNVLFAPAIDQEDEHIYWGALGINFTPAIALKAAYYAQEIQTGPTTESPNSFQAIIDIKQDALKFTSFWAEYRSFDNNSQLGSRAVEHVRRCYWYESGRGLRQRDVLLPEAEVDRPVEHIPALLHRQRPQRDPRCDRQHDQLDVRREVQLHSWAFLRACIRQDRELPYPCQRRRQRDPLQNSHRVLGRSYLQAKRGTLAGSSFFISPV